MIRVLLVAVFLLNSPVLALGEREDWTRVQSLAKAHYDIIMLLIKGKEYDKVISESQKIFSLNFPEDKEALLVKSALGIADSLRHCERYDLAHQVIDDAVRVIRSDGQKAALYEEKAFTFEKEGKRENALDYFQKAQQLKSAAR